jgi:hypothetical protein
MLWKSEEEIFNEIRNKISQLKKQQDKEYIKRGVDPEHLGGISPTNVMIEVNELPISKLLRDVSFDLVKLKKLSGSEFRKLTKEINKKINQIGGTIKKSYRKSGKKLVKKSKKPSRKLVKKSSKNPSRKLVKKSARKLVVK